MNILSDFLRGFAVAAELNDDSAADQWGAFSNQLSDAERAKTESGGYEAGIEMGKEFAALYPAEDPNLCEKDALPDDADCVSAPDREETFREDVIHGESVWGF